MTCPVIPDKPSDPKPFFENGNLNFKAHDVGWLMCGIMALIATISSFWLIWKHLTYYTCPQQQRHIVRLLIMVPVYAIVSFMSYLFYHEALYYQTIRDCYEAVLVTSFFYLILAYTGDTRAEQHAVFRNLKFDKWVWPLGRWKYKPEGLHFLWLMKISVLQYAIVRPVCTFAAVGLEYFGYYCLHSWMPWFGHVWCAVLISISVTVAMYCLIQLYMPVRALVDPYKPILKFLAIKTIVFLTFWQDTFLSFLVSFGVIKDSEFFTGEQIQAGINALLQCFWMLLFGFIHIKAFSYLPYRPEDKSKTTLRGKAALDCLDFRDWFWEMKESTRYMAARSKGRQYTLAEDLRADRHQHLLKALGKERTVNLNAQIDIEKANLPTFWKNPDDSTSPYLYADHADHDDSASSSDHNKWTARSTSAAADQHWRQHMPQESDKYTSPHSKRKFEHTSKFSNAEKASGNRKGLSPSQAKRRDHAARTAELKALVAQLDLEDNPRRDRLDRHFDQDDGDRERDALLTEDARDRDQEKRDSLTPSTPSIRYLDEDVDRYPELSRYHAADLPLANVPALEYDDPSATVQINSAATYRRNLDLSAVQENLEEGEQNRHGYGNENGPSRIAPGVGAFGIAGWLGWSSSGGNNVARSHSNNFSNGGDYRYAAPSQQNQADATEPRYGQHLSPHAYYDPHASGANASGGAEGGVRNSWWRNYWDRASNADGESRGPSTAGHGDIDDVHEYGETPLSPAAPPRIGQVSGGSWGPSSHQPRSLSPYHQDHHQQQQQERQQHRDGAYSHPALTIETSRSGPDPHRRIDPIDSPGSSSRFSPDAESPLSRLIQTSRGSLGSISAGAVAGTGVAQSGRPLPAAPLSQAHPHGTATLIVKNDEGKLASRHASINPSSRPSQSHGSAASSSRQAQSQPHYSSAHAYSSGAPPPQAWAVEQDRTQISRHPIVYRDALEAELPEDVVRSATVAVDLAAQQAEEKSKRPLPPAVGPKGKLFNLVLPSPLSPARYPYGQEGALPSGPTMQPRTRAESRAKK
ncbi:DUF300-domain-containing protein [Testicularia cyperi]|uniref:DUF300-domain-containing protein n=1 Tax=Testicularia cyperi TaxID=1882483 RepID=A0A317XGW9_9BASI|nr:DUF300-domain-containing protein [Testicularia cyperi]